MFYGSLSTPSGANILITQDSAQIRIIDDDGMYVNIIIATFTNHFYPVSVWFQPSIYMVHEDNETVTVIIRTNVPGGPPAGSVAFTTVDGTALGEKAKLMLFKETIIVLIYLFRFE